MKKMINIMIYFYRKMQHEKQVRMKLWRVKWNDIEWTRKRKFSASGSKVSLN